MAVKFQGAWTKKDIELNTDNLTENELKVMIAIRNNDYSDIIESNIGDWSFGVCDASGLNQKVYRGVISSLIKKEYVQVYGRGDEATVKLTEKGKQMYSDYKK